MARKNPKADNTATAPETREPDPVVMLSVPTDAIVVHEQVRKKFDPKAHAELTESVRSIGILQPLLVRQGEDNKYHLIAGERRLRAAKEAKLAEVPVRVAFAQDNTLTTLQVVENIQREELTLEEQAAAFDLLYKQTGRMSEVARLLSKSMPWVSKMYSVANKLGKLSTELLAGGFTQDVELLTVLSRCEAMENGWPRVELIADEIRKKKAGRAEVIALHDELKAELESSPDGDGEGEGEGAGTGEPATLGKYGAMDNIHQAMIDYAENALKQIRDDSDAYDPFNTRDFIATQAKAWEAHFWLVIREAHKAKWGHDPDVDVPDPSA